MYKIKFKGQFMKKNILILIFLSLTLFTQTHADTQPKNYNKQAEYKPLVFNYTPHPYFGVAFGFTNVKDDFLYNGTNELTDIDYDTLMAQFGYEYNPFISIEGRYWKSITKGDYNVLTNSEAPAKNSYEDMSSFGLYLKPAIPITKEFSLYMLLGVANVNVDGKSQWNTSLIDEWGFSWGLGCSFSIIDDLSIFVDYVQLYDDTYDGYYNYYPTYQPQLTTIDTFNFGLTYKF